MRALPVSSGESSGAFAASRSTMLPLRPARRLMTAAVTVIDASPRFGNCDFRTVLISRS